MESHSLSLLLTLLSNNSGPELKEKLIHQRGVLRVREKYEPMTASSEGIKNTGKGVLAQESGKQGYRLVLS